MLWDTNAKINGLVAADLETIVSHIIPDFPQNVGFANGLFVMTTATDHKNNLNRSVLKKDNPRTLRVETIANSAARTAQVAIVAQPSIGFLNGRYYSDGSLRKTLRTAYRSHHSWSYPLQIADCVSVTAWHVRAHGMA